MTNLSASQLRYWLALNHLYNLTPDDVKRIVECADNLEELFKISILRKRGFSANFIKQVQNLNWNSIDVELQWAEKPNHSVVTLIGDEYPTLLREIPDPPLLLYVKGNVSVLSQPQIAIVGSRNTTPVGRETAKQFAAYLAQSGFVITSGLALGIDGAAHEGALEAGTTIAVCGAGLDSIYPRRHEHLAERISEQGALISEFPLSVSPRKENFPLRNRIISGLSIGTLVVEAAQRSGSLITARLAGEQGREVFAIPGSIHNPLSKGCHQLIRQGAKLVETAEDIMNELAEFTKLSKELAKTNSTTTKENQGKNEKKNQSSLDFMPLDNDYRKLLCCVGFESTAVDVIIDRSDLSTEVVSSMLLMLELQGYIQSVPGGYMRCK